MNFKPIFQIRVVSQEVRFTAAQLDELYNLFKVSRRHENDKMEKNNKNEKQKCHVLPFFFFFQRQHFRCCYWTMKSPALLHHDPSLAYLEQYQLGFQQFSVLFSLLEPWAFCSTKSPLSLWIFRLIDENQDGLVNFKEFCCALGEFARSLHRSANAAVGLSSPTAITSNCFSHRYFAQRIFHK